MVEGVIELDVAKYNLGKVKTKPMQRFAWDIWGDTREVCRGIAIYFAAFDCLLLFPPSLPLIFLG